jgi:hypothetical protein
MVCPGFPSVGCQSSHFPDLLPLNTTPLLDTQLVLELQPNQLITITRLDINLTPKNKPFTTRLILLSSPRHRFGLFILLPPEHKVDTIRTPELHVYNHLDPHGAVWWESRHGSGHNNDQWRRPRGVAGGGMRWRYAVHAYL